MKYIGSVAGTRSGSVEVQYDNAPLGNMLLNQRSFRKFGGIINFGVLSCYNCSDLKIIFIEMVKLKIKHNQCFFIKNLSIHIYIYIYTHCPILSRLCLVVSISFYFEKLPCPYTCPVILKTVLSFVLAVTVSRVLVRFCASQ